MNLPAGMPPVTITKWVPIEDIGSLLPLAVVVMCIDLLESTSIARALARVHGWVRQRLQQLWWQQLWRRRRPGARKLQSCVRSGLPLTISHPLPQCTSYELRYNQEVVAMGVANFFGAAFSSYTTTGSFSRSAVNNASGAFVWMEPAAQLPTPTQASAPVAAVPRTHACATTCYVPSRHWRLEVMHARLAHTLAHSPPPQLAAQAPRRSSRGL